MMRIKLPFGCSTMKSNNDQSNGPITFNLHLNLGLVSVSTNPPSEQDRDSDEDKDDQEGKLNVIGPLD